jgi:hypothetical protein
MHSPVESRTIRVLRLFPPFPGAAAAFFTKSLLKGFASVPDIENRA